MTRGLTQECVKSFQGWIALRLAAKKPLVETAHMLHVQCPTQIIVDADGDGQEKANPHPCFAVRKVGITVGC